MEVQEREMPRAKKPKARENHRESGDESDKEKARE